MNFVNVIWRAQCGKSARWVLLGETSPRSTAPSVRALLRKRQTTAGLRKRLLLQGSSLLPFGFRVSIHTGRDPDILTRLVSPEMIAHSDDRDQSFQRIATSVTRVRD